MRDIKRVVSEVFRTTAGKELMEYMESTYQPRKLYNENTTKMAYNVGQFDVVQDLKAIIEDAKQ